MQESTNINIRMDKDVKNTAAKIFNELGLNMTTVINIFLRKAIQEQGKDLDKLFKILSNGEPLLPKYKDYALSGNYIGVRECHIESDWLLIYSIKMILLF